MSSVKIGDRVSWMGAIDFGRKDVAWIGTVVQLGYGESYGEIGPDLSWKELGRHPAVKVEPDYPQHGKTERLVHEKDLIIAIKDLCSCPGVMRTGCPCPKCHGRGWYPSIEWIESLKMEDEMERYCDCADGDKRRKADGP